MNRVSMFSFKRLKYFQIEDTRYGLKSRLKPKNGMINILVLASKKTK